jgi:hypothetical protein
MAAAALLEASKDVLQPLQFRSHKSVFAGSEAVHGFVHHPRRKKTHRICAIPRRAVGALSNQYLIICVGLSAVLARAVPGTYSVRTEFYAIHKQLLRV